MIDYIQLMTSGKKVESRQVEVSEFSRQIKLLAKELEIPIVALAQLNRGSEQRADKKPMVSDLRESGSLEQDADIVMLVHREDMYERESPRAGEADIIVGKHRNGPMRDITVRLPGPLLPLRRHDPLTPRNCRGVAKLDNSLSRSRSGERVDSSRAVPALRFARGSLAADPVRRTILDRAPQLGPADRPGAMVPAVGAAFENLWNAGDGRPPGRGLNDYDACYFDDSDRQVREPTPAPHARPR